MPRGMAPRRASSMSRGPQQRPPAEALEPLASYRRMVRPTARAPDSPRSAGAVALSTPPDKATAIGAAALAGEVSEATRAASREAVPSGMPASIDLFMAAEVALHCRRAQG